VQFTYNGFTQEGNNRCYSFDGKEEQKTTAVYRLWVDLSLFVKHRVSLQNGPGFCLQLLNSACAGGPEQMDHLRDYHTIDSDFSNLLAERAAQAAALALKKPARRPFRKPPPSSQLRRQLPSSV
jgi:hypothetical protein